MVCGLFVTLEKLDLAPELFHLDDRSFLEDGLLGRVPFNIINLFSLDSVDFVHEQVRLIFLGRSRLQLLILVAKRLDYLIQINALHKFHLSGHAFQMVQSLDLGRLELDQLVLLDLFELHLVPQPVENLILRRYLVLDLHKLLLEYFLTLLSFSQLFPQDSVGAQLLLEVVNLVVMLLLLDCFFELRK